MLPFFDHEGSFWVGSSATWNIMKMDEALCKDTGGNLGRNVPQREGRPIPRISVHSSKDKALFLS